MKAREPHNKIKKANKHSAKTFCFVTDDSFKLTRLIKPFHKTLLMSHSYKNPTGQMGLVGQPRYDWFIAVPNVFNEHGAHGTCRKKYTRCKATYIAPWEIPAGVMEFTFVNNVKSNLSFRSVSSLVNNKKYCEENK